MKAVEMQNTKQESLLKQAKIIFHFINLKRIFYNFRNTLNNLNFTLIISKRTSKNSLRKKEKKKNSHMHLQLYLELKLI